MDITQLKPYAKNAKRHPLKQIEQIAASIEAFGFNQPIVVDKENVVIIGHGRLEAAKLLGMQDVPVVVVDLVPELAAAYRLADNKLNESAWDMNLVIEELSLLEPEQMALTGFDLDSLKPNTSTPGALATNFGIPPFSVWDTRQGYWQDRKREWLALGIESELGRGEDLIYNQEQLDKYNGASSHTGTSVFDPVLCETVYNWFCPTGGSVLDPFAGGSVRGIIAGKLGLNYEGIELSEAQVVANRAQASKLLDKANAVLWREGDSNVILDDVAGGFDLLFSCPPYADLEVYSDDPADLSNMPYEQFKTVYTSIIEKAVSKLKPDRFAVFVVGDIRDKKGFYRNFVDDTKTAFINAGAGFYNEIVLVNALGTLPLRAGKTFKASRKVGKTHQNVLVFFKGDPSTIKATYGEDVALTVLADEADDTNGLILS